MRKSFLVLGLIFVIGGFMSCDNGNSPTGGNGGSTLHPYLDLALQTDDGGTAWRVQGFRTDAEIDITTITELVIPDNHNGVPVRTIHRGPGIPPPGTGFVNMAMQIERVIIGRNIQFIASGIFTGRPTLTQVTFLRIPPDGLVNTWIIDSFDEHVAFFDGDGNELPVPAR